MISSSSLDNEWTIDYKKDFLGIGHFSLGVYRATNKKDLSKVVIKFSQKRKETKEFLDNLKNIKNENIGRYFDYKEGTVTVIQDKNTERKEEDAYFIFMEHLEGYENLENFLENKTTLNEKNLAKVASSLLIASKILNENKTIHRDVKSANIYIKEDSNGDIDLKFIDYGISRRSFYEDNTGPVGTRDFESPESKYSNITGSLSDVYSVGMVLIMAAGGNIREINLKSGLPDIPKELSQACKSFISYAIITKKEDRPRITELLQHDFLTPNGRIHSYINKDPSTHYKDSTFNGPLESLQISENIKHLELSMFDQQFEKLPDSINSINFENFNQELLEESIHTNIEEAHFKNFNIIENGSNLPSMKKFSCDYEFTAPFKTNNNIPKKSLCLEFKNYNQPISRSSFPTTLQALTLGSDYKHFQSLSNLPVSLIDLTFGFWMDKIPIPTHDENEWVIEKEPLGKGSLSLGVFKAKKKDDAKIYAVKIILKEKTGRYELQILNRLEEAFRKNNNIIKIYGYDEDKNNLYIYMEYLKGYKTIKQVIEQGKIFSENEISKIIKKIVKVVVDLHNMQIIHRDIKGDNIMIDLNKSNNIKLIDFGISKSFKGEDSRYYTLIGTITHMAPEVLLQNGIANSKSDIWSIGCTLIEMAGGSLEKNERGIPKIPAHLKNNCRNFVQHCLLMDPKTRPTASELLDHEFLSKSSSRPIESPENQITLLNKDLNKISCIDSDKSHLFLPDFDEYNYLPFLKSISPNITALTLYSFNQIILPDSLPKSITSLTLNSFNQEIKPYSIPSSITYLSIPSFNHDLEYDSIPESVTELVLGQVFELEYNGGFLPASIKILTCSYKFKKPLKRNNNIPKDILVLVLDNYNFPITIRCFPETIHTLTLGSNFTHFESLSNLPQSSIFNLTLGVENCALTDEEIKQFIPKTITKLTINRTNPIEINKPLINDWEIDCNNELYFSESKNCIGFFKARILNGIFNNKIIPNNGECIVNIFSKEDNYIHIGTWEQLENIKHNNILETYGHYYGDYEKYRECLIVFMEYIKGYKSISELLNKGYKFSENEIKKVANYLLFTLAFLHKKKIIHRDIKGSNILYHNSNDNQVNIKLFNFGFSKFYGDKQSNYHTFAGTPTHMAPEALYQNNKAGRRSDIWSVGCTLIEMAGGDLFHRVNGTPEIPEHLSDECKNLIQHCLIVEPLFRPRAIELLEHDFIKNVNDLSERNKKILKKITICQDNTIKLYNKDLFSVFGAIYIDKKHLIFPEFNNTNLSRLLSTLPSNITHITLPIFNHPIEPNSIPSTITSLTMNSFNQDLDENSIPNTLTELILGEEFEFNEYGGNIPESINKFECSYNFKSALKKNNNIPKTVKSLVLNNYNHPIVKGSIPKSTRSLTLGSNFKDFASLSNIPSSVFNLTFGVKDYQISDDELKFIPKTVTKLTIIKN
ncbi:hypothetical protein DICPUDRAFT_147525 [Dictyostelium purpureum]|uniref:Protein kinase domain-containing protein n=1 Tax=Dictyostelium purpureum TaxID=5786 RepID=F0Z8Q2_DICPU|nr:uncharacterized protein DICPUDRAFT_147525 [Dictyostelium purpureum]EGC39699.1 hypothetical protein DICPUDRAFT_147525 [Dictyostelium purpureum]|eukprot:XP_003283808.1 hypothetical protein DICPUDRAFT_147525 [Dictyostelium purpureum]